MSVDAITRPQTAILSLFPLLLLTTVAVNRIASLLLGSHPSSLFVWGVWLEVRPVTRVAAGLLGFVTERSSGTTRLADSRHDRDPGHFLLVPDPGGGLQPPGFFFLHRCRSPRTKALPAIPPSLGAFVATRQTLYLVLFTLGLCSCIYCTVSIVHRARRSRAVTRAATQNLLDPGRALSGTMLPARRCEVRIACDASGGQFLSSRIQPRPSVLRARSRPPAPPAMIFTPRTPGRRLFRRRWRCRSERGRRVSM